MNKYLLTIALLFGILKGFAQNYCGSLRYDTVVFPSVTVTSNIIYGINTDVGNKLDTLKMDIYEPTGDTATIRPLVVMAHGGSFVSGDKTDLTYICTELSKRGYVTASINYRLGLGFPIDSIRAMRAVWRATQDMKAAVRYFRKDAATTNTYKVDPNMIFIGGASAGAIMAVHYAYLDQPSEIPAIIDTVLLGGLEGSSGNAGYSSSVKAVVNICGALADTCWMKPGDEDLVSLQGNNDNTVPYCSDYVYLASFKIMVIHGLRTMNICAQNIGLYNPMHTFYGQGHSSPGDTINIDTTIALTSQFLYKELGCTSSDLTDYTNMPLCLKNLTNTQQCIQYAGVKETMLDEGEIILYPNPSSENITVSIRDAKGKKFRGEVLDISGRKISDFNFNSKDYVIRKNVSPGIYFLKLTSDAHELFVTKIIFTE